MIDGIYLSTNHTVSFVPPVDSFSQYSSTSCWVLQFTIKDIDSVNFDGVPPFNATNPCPSSLKDTYHNTAFSDQVLLPHNN